MRSHWKPVLALMLVTPFVTELLSGSLPAAKFFQPQVFLFLATVGYGFPILLLREFAVRHRLGLLGLVALGWVYGIFNEGIIAKTFYLVANVPIRNFDGYGCAGGIAVPWAVMISTWHALHAFLYPLVAIYYFFPAQRESPWLDGKGIILLAIPTVVLGTLIFFGHGMGRPAGHGEHFIVMLAISGLLLWGSSRLPSPKFSDHDRLRLQPFFLGALNFVLLVFVPILMAGAKVPAAILCGYCALVIFFGLRKLGQRPSLPTPTVLSFALGDEMVMTLLGFALAAGHGNPERLLVNAAFLVLWVWLIARLRRPAE